MDGAALSSVETAPRAPRTLIPFDKEEATTVAAAAEKVGRCETTIRTWCRQPHHIGRRIGGAWVVSKVALNMLIEGDFDALAAYHDGARAGYEPVARHYRRVGLGHLLKRPEFGAAQE
jgi:hypothetical protein